MIFKMFLSNLRSKLNSSPNFITRNFRCSRLRIKDAKLVENEKTDQPIQYTTSEAAKWKAIYSTTGEDYFHTPRIQPFVVMMSLTAFMVYFCILREENDLDEWLLNLEKNVPLQVEEAQLRVDIAEAKKRGQNTKLLDARYNEIQEKKKQLSN